MLPEGFTTRPPVMADAEAVTALENERARRDIGTGDTTVERTLLWWNEPDRSLESDNVLVISDDGEIIASADYSEYAPYTTSDFTFVVAPAFEGRGIEEFLIAWANDRAQKTLQRARVGERVVVGTSVWAANRADQARLRRAGYEPSRVWNRMLIEMDALPEEPTWPEGVSVRTFVPDEIDAVHEAWEDAQRDEWGHSSLTDDEFRYYFMDREEHFDPTLWFLAIDAASSAIIGYTICRWERPGEPEVGHIRYVAVRRPYRRRGIARALLLHTFREFYRRGKPKVGLAVDSTSLTGADQLYERAGMRAVQRSIVFVRDVGQGLLSKSE